MNITSVRVGIIPNPKNSIVGMATIEIDRCLVLSSMKIVEGKNGLFVSMPSMKGKDKEGKDGYRDVYYFMDKSKIDKLNDVIIAEYIKKSGESMEPVGDGDIPF